MKTSSDSKRVWAAHAAAVTAAAGLGGAASGSGTDWYRRLKTPPWQPPPAVFGPVWTGLYGLIAYAGGAVWQNSEEPERRRFAVAYGTNLALNAGWTWTFFRAHKLPLAAVHAVVLEVSTLDLIRRARRVAPHAAVALAPYAASNAFATALSTDLARRNRRNPSA
jgi:translocator protein